MGQLTELLQVIRGDNFVILDSETTGLNEGEIVQLSILASNGDVLMNQYIKPVNGIPESATAIHGITLEKVANAPSITTLFPEIKRILTGTHVIVYNADYDYRMLLQSLLARQMPAINFKQLSPWYCAMKGFAEIYKDWDMRRKSFKWKKLEVACNYYGIPVKDAHNSLGDCQMTLEVCRRMAGITSVEVMGQSPLF